MLFKILSSAKGLILLITWCIAAGNNKSSYGNIEVEPEADDDECSDGEGGAGSDADSEGDKDDKSKDGDDK